MISNFWVSILHSNNYKEFYMIDMKKEKLFRKTTNTKMILDDIRKQIESRPDSQSFSYSILESKTSGKEKKHRVSDTHLIETKIA